MCVIFDGLGSATRHVFQPLFVQLNRLCDLCVILLYFTTFTKTNDFSAAEAAMVAAHGAGAGFQDIAERPPLRAWSDPGTDAESFRPPYVASDGVFV